MEYTFKDILIIKNGKNQKTVQNPNGRYPIYGSGGIIGYADKYICESNTVIIGRKGSINNPIFVSEPFWNVDTAFGLVANKEYLLPLYLFYFCKKFDFNKLNKTVTIPSLTKTDLLNIKIELPQIDKQQKIVDKLRKIESIIELRKGELKLLDTLIKARFVEMFGDMLLNTMNWQELKLDEIAEIVSGITKGRKIKEKELFEVPYMAVSNVKDGYINWTTVKTIMASQSEIDKYQLKPFDVLMTEGGDPDKVGRGAIIYNPPKNCIHQNHIFRVRLNRNALLPEYMEQYLQQQKAKRYFLGCAKQTTGIASINMRQLMVLPVLVPEMEVQREFVKIKRKIDKSKIVYQTTLNKLTIFTKSLL